jgi:ATP-binding protein involved in chromosome partitioning
MKIAVPTENGVLCPHFGHCRSFAILEVDTEKKEIMNSETLIPPQHEPGVLPLWLSRMGCNLVIVGGMGGRAMSIFGDNGIGVICGAPAQPPEDIVAAYLNGELITGGNVCDEQHSSGHGRKENCRKHEED